MVTDSTGLLFDFQDSSLLAKAVNKLLGDETLRRNMGLNAFHHTRAGIWENVAIAHAKLFRQLTQSNRTLKYDLPEFSSTITYHD